MSQVNQCPRRVSLSGLFLFFSALPALVLAGCQQPLPVLLPGFAPPAPAPQPMRASHPYLGEVVSVVSGDTLRVRRDGQQALITVRLVGVRTPRPGERLGVRAKQLTEKLLLGQRVQVEPAPTDTIALVSPSQTPGRHLNRALVRAGLAWTNEMFPTSIGAVAQDMVNDENAARNARRGLWSDPAFRSPKEIIWRMPRQAAPKPQGANP